MRKENLEVHDRAELEAIIRSCKTIRLGMVSSGSPYILPMVFGWSWTGEYPVFYMHCSMTGRKSDALYDGARVCFEMDLEGELTGRTAYANGYSREFCCVMGEGTLAFARSNEEKIRFFEPLMRHQTGRDGFTYQPGWLTLTEVFALRVDSMSAARKGMEEIRP